MPEVENYHATRARDIDMKPIFQVLVFAFFSILASRSLALEPLPDILLETHYRTSECEDMETIKGPEPIIAVLSDVARLYALPCTSSSHDDVTYRVYLFETGEIGGIRPLLFSLYTPKLGWVGTDILRGVKLDAATGKITHRTLSRWGGACGTFGQWKWNDFTLKMLEFRIRKSCGTSKSVKDWVVIYSNNN